MTPTEPGWYWFYDNEDDDWLCAHVMRAYGDLWSSVGGLESQTVSECDGHWGPPIHRPGELAFVDGDVIFALLRELQDAESLDHLEWVASDEVASALDDVRDLAYGEPCLSVLMFHQMRSLLDASDTSKRYDEGIRAAAMAMQIARLALRDIGPVDEVNK